MGIRYRYSTKRLRHERLFGGALLGVLAQLILPQPAHGAAVDVRLLLEDLGGFDAHDGDVLRVSGQAGGGHGGVGDEVEGAPELQRLAVTSHGAELVQVAEVLPAGRRRHVRMLLAVLIDDDVLVAASAV